MINNGGLTPMIVNKDGSAMEDPQPGTSATTVPLAQHPTTMLMGGTNTDPRRPLSKVPSKITDIFPYKQNSYNFLTPPQDKHAFLLYLPNDL